jgi:hypothetical protein
MALTMLHHDLEELDHDLGGRPDHHLNNEGGVKQAERKKKQDQ